MAMDKIGEYLTNIGEYLIDDLLRILTLIGGAGGLLYWYDRYRNRTRLRVMLLDFGLTSKSAGQQACIRFEAENLGTMPLSLDPLVSLTGIVPVVMQRKSGPRLHRDSYNYKIETTDRSLPPHTPKVFEAYGESDDMRPFLWFITYTFKSSRGKVKKIRIRSADKYHLSLARYVCELALYAVGNKLYIDRKFI